VTFRSGRESDFALLKKGLDNLLGQHTHLTDTTRNLNDPKKFWEVVKSTSGAAQQNELLKFLVHGSVNLTDNLSMLNFFNEHFVSVGHLFDKENPNQLNSNMGKESNDEAVNSPTKNLFTLNLCPHLRCAKP